MATLVLMVYRDWWGLGETKEKMDQTDFVVQKEDGAQMVNLVLRAFGEILEMMDSRACQETKVTKELLGRG